MASERQIAANRRNARKSTGPRSGAGKNRSSRNAYRHGLTLSIASSAAVTKQLDKLIRKIAGDTKDPILLERARALAQAELDLARVRRAKVALIDICVRRARSTGAHLVFFVQCTSIAKLVGNIRQHATQNLIAAPSLKASMHSFVVRVTLWQHVPLRACVENPQYRFKHTTRRSRLAPRTSIANILLRKMIPDAFPLLVREPNHPTFISDRQQSAILR
jgi:hypothetical protein